MRLTQSMVEQFIKLASGSFSTRDIWAELGINMPENKAALRVILYRLEQAGKIVKTSKDGLYRIINDDMREIDWQNADPSKTVPISLPFEIHKLCKIYPKSIIILAGEKNAGKTAFLYKCVQQNMNRFQVDLFNNEMGPEQMKERFSSLGIPNPAPFKVYDRNDKFSDVIHPEHLSIIDYLDLNSEVYLVGTEIDAIFQKLTTGVAIIGLQKPPATVTWNKGKKIVQSRDLAYGGGFTAKRACLYISLGEYKLKLVYAKTPANPKVNPNNMQWSYTFDESGYFMNVERYYSNSF